MARYKSVIILISEENAAEAEQIFDKCEYTLWYEISEPSNGFRSITFADTDDDALMRICFDFMFGKVPFTKL